MKHLFNKNKNKKTLLLYEINFTHKRFNASPFLASSSEKVPSTPCGAEAYHCSLDPEKGPSLNKAHTDSNQLTIYPEDDHKANQELQQNDLEH